MKIKLNTNLIPLFSGTYETWWEVQETDDHGNDIYVAYDFKEFMTTIAHAYHNHEDIIVRDLEIPWIKKIEFDGNFSSPREYNFSTDTLDFTLTVDRTAMLKAIKALQYNKEFDTFLYDNFTSRSGFMSFTPNNYLDLKEQIVSQGDEFEQAVGALIQFIAMDKFMGNGSEFYQTIEGTIHESWSCNGYGGLNYESQCNYCYKPVEYENDFDCTNKDCEASK